MPPVVLFVSDRNHNPSRGLYDAAQKANYCTAQKAKSEATVLPIPGTVLCDADAANRADPSSEYGTLLKCVTAPADLQAGN